MAADLLDQERKAFEAWAVKFGLPIEHHPTAPSTNYLNRDTTFAWVGWQGKAAPGVTTTLAPAELGHGLKTGTTETNTAGLPGMDGAAAAEKLREDTRMQGHCGICGALYPQHHAGCTSGVDLPDGAKR